MSAIIPQHKRILPHMDISEQGLAELEIWLRRRTAAASTLDLPFAYIAGANGTLDYGNPNTFYIDMSDQGATEPIGGVAPNSLGCFNSGTNDDGTYYTRDWVTPALQTYKFYTINFHKAGTYTVDYSVLLYEGTMSFDPRVVSCGLAQNFLDYDSAWLSTTQTVHVYGQRVPNQQEWQITARDIVILDVDRPSRPKYILAAINNNTGHDLFYVLSVFVQWIGPPEGNSTAGHEWHVSGNHV